MKLQGTMDFTTLTWVKRELDETLQQARQALETYVEDPADSSVIRFCASYLHQVHGTLRMVELYGATMVVEEMEQVALALLDGSIPQKEEAYAALMRGIVQLPDYLERLQSGHKDIPVVLLPLLNELRACRGEKSLSEAAMFSPILSVPVPMLETVIPQPTAAELPTLITKLRSAFQIALLKWFRGDNSADQLKYLTDVLDRLRGLSTHEEVRRLWWIASAVLETVHYSAHGASAEVKLLVGKVEREIKRMAEMGEADFHADHLRDLVKNLLHYIAQATTTGERGSEVKRLYKLESLLPTAQEIEHARSSIAGHNRTLLTTVSQVVKEDLIRVKESLDIFLRTPGKDPTELLSQVDVLSRVADTLNMIGLITPRRVVMEQRQIIQDVAEKNRNTEGEILLNVASSLLYTEASLDDHIERLGGSSTEEPEKTGTSLPAGEMRKVFEALLKEVTTNLARAKQDIVAFIESPWDHARVESVPHLLEEIGGALRVLTLPEAAEFVTGIIRFIEAELLKHRRVPTADQMDKLADALASIEYYLEAIGEQRSGSAAILEVTRRSLEALGYWPVPEKDVPEKESASLFSEQSSIQNAVPTTSISVPAATFTPLSTTDYPVVHEEQGPAWQERSLDNLIIPPTLEPTWPKSSEGMDLTFPTANGLLVEKSGDNMEAFIAGLNEQVSASIAPPVSPVDVSLSTLVTPPNNAEIPAGDSISANINLIDEDSIVVREDSAETTLPSTTSSVAETVTESVPQYIEIFEEIEEEVPDDDAVASAANEFQIVASEDIDEEILDVFIEEVQEEIDSLNHNLPLWTTTAQDFEHLKPIRRSFHTLKGSGRLVGAMALGEFSWKIESLLNCVLDKSIEPNSAVQILVRQAIEALPDLLAALRGNSKPKANIAGIMAVADKLATGEEAWLEPPQPPRMKIVKRLVSKWVPAPAAESIISLHSLEVNNAATESIETVPTASEEVTGPSPTTTLQIEIAAEPDTDTLFTTDFPVDKTEPETSSLLTLDPLLFDILRTEVATHLSVIDDYLAQTAIDALPASEGLLRAVHTLNGAIAMIDIPVIGHVLAPLEGYIKRLRAMDAAPSAEGRAVIKEMSELVKEVMLTLEQSHPQLPNSDNLVTRATLLRDELAEPTSMTHTLFAMPDDKTDLTAATIEIEQNEKPDLVHAISDVDISPSLQDTVEPDFAQSEASMLTEQPTEIRTIDEEETFLTALDEFDSSEVSTIPSEVVDFSAPLTEQKDTFALDTINTDELSSGWEQLLTETQTQGDLASYKKPSDDLAVFTDSEIETINVSEAQNYDLISSPLNRPSLYEETSKIVDTTPQQEIINAESPTLSSETSVEDAEETAFLAALDEFGFSELSTYPLAVANSTEQLSHTALSDIESEWIEPLISGVTPFSSHTEPKGESGEELPLIADDPQPEGKLNLADMDADLLEVFVQEARDLLDHSDGLLANLRDTPQDRTLVTGLQRDLHTLKGGALMAGLTPIADLSHVMESLLELISENRRQMNRGIVESLERAFDRLHQLTERVARSQAIARPANIIARFEALVLGHSPVVEAPFKSDSRVASSSPSFTPAPSIKDSTAVPIPSSASVEPLPLAQRITVPGIGIEDEEPQRAQQEMIRVRAELLDSLVNYAGEVSIYRSRLEQQMSTFRFNLVEFEQTVNRLRGQLRKLEIETEAQILSRFQRETDSTDEAFDPLELDRFSQQQQLSRALAESVSDLVSIQNLLDELTRQSETLLLQQSRVSSDLQEGLMRTRMVPFDSLVPSLRRTVRQATSEVGKRVQLKVEGAQGEMDRNLLERMKAPFEHMLRNAVAHGIELPEERVKAGKAAEGTVNITVSREGTEVVIRVSDDGKGMDRDAIRRKAIERGLLRPDAQLSDRDLYGFVLETGFSTAEKITQLSGRGVGMDVVHSEIKQLGGSLAIDSTRGMGTTFIIRLPFTLAITRAILIRLGEVTYAVPMSSVQSIVRITREELSKLMAQPIPTFSYAGEEFLIYEWWKLLGVDEIAHAEGDQVPLLLTRTGDQRAAVRIGNVIGSREVVVKSVGPQISSVPGIFGATIMGDGSVVMILDLAPLVRRNVALREHMESNLIEAAVPIKRAIVPVSEQQRQALVMVVDDSITMRKVTTRVLERSDMQVVTAKDGLDALEKLHDMVPDLVLLDVEMPRMDGYELATYMKNDARLRAVPIMMITSRTGEKHRQRALEIGVERYLGKPYQEIDLIKNVRDMLRLHRAEH